MAASSTTLAVGGGKVLKREDLSASSSVASSQDLRRYVSPVLVLLGSLDTSEQHYALEVDKIFFLAREPVGRSEDTN